MTVCVNMSSVQTYAYFYTDAVSPASIIHYHLYCPLVCVWCSIFGTGHCRCYPTTHSDLYCVTADYHIRMYS